MTHASHVSGKATQQQTKAHNDSLVLSTIYEADEISRAAIARRTGLSRTSAGEAARHESRSGGIRGRRFSRL